MSYNGWENRETWNVALWIQNDEGLYNLARETEDYPAFAEFMRDSGSTETPDGVAWNDSGLDIERLNEMFDELKGLEVCEACGDKFEEGTECEACSEENEDD